MAMPIDVRQVDWLYVAILALFALVTNLLANLLSFRRRGVAAVLAAVLFAAAFVFWTYYPHGLPLPTTLRDQKSTATTTNNLPAETPPSSAPQRPSNPVTDITPPSSNSR
jgi:predicted cobalt transporter CbtA